MGISIPFRIDPATGGLATERGREKIKENIAHLLLTGVGERTMRRGYGAGLRRLVHDPLNEALVALARHQIAQAIGEFEPRVQLVSVDVSSSYAGGEGTLLIDVRYVVRQTRQADHLAIPVSLGGL